MILKAVVKSACAPSRKSFPQALEVLRALGKDVGAQVLGLCVGEGPGGNLFHFHVELEGPEASCEELLDVMCSHLRGYAVWRRAETAASIAGRFENSLVEDDENVRQDGHLFSFDSIEDLMRRIAG